MKALSLLFQMRYGSLLSSKKWLSTIPKCRGYLVEVGALQKATKWHKVWCGLKCTKSVIILKNMGQLLNLDHLETTKWNYKKIGWPRPEKLKFEKGWFERKQNHTTLRVDKKQGVAEPFGLSLGHFMELSRLSYLIWKRRFRAICWYIFLNFFQANRYYLSLFLSCSRVCHISSTIWYVTL